MRAFLTIVLGVLCSLYSQTLPDAVDDTLLPWFTGGDSVWFYQTTYFFYDGDAAQSGGISDFQSTYLGTVVQSPCSLKFYWKVSSEAGYDYLRFYRTIISGNAQLFYSISGDVDWNQKKIVIWVPGEDTLRWVYAKDGSGSYGQDAGWVDFVEYFPISNTQVTIPEGVDNSALLWETGGDGSWTGETALSFDGSDAVVSGRISHYQSVYLKTVVQSPCSLKFYWKVSSEAGYDYLRFYRYYRGSDLKY